jgi:chemotaxis protein methyltransferase CheR
MTAPLSPQLFSLLTSIVEERAGLHYGVDDLIIFSDKVWNRLQDAGFASPLDYYYFLRYDAGGETEISNLIDSLVVGETYLFREIDGLTAAMENVIRPAIERRGRARVWSAGCSTGEEPATLAMLLAEMNLLDRVDIIATDVSTRHLRRAREGIFSSRSLRVLAPGRHMEAPPWIVQLADRFITGRDTPQPILQRSISAAIDFRRDSLLAPAESLVDFDLILCRNVLIYFRDDVVRRVVESLAGRLRADGRLLVGASESLLRFGTLLRCEERAGAFFYVKDS